MLLIAYLFALKSNRSVSRAIFLKQLLDAKDQDIFVSEFRQLWSIEAALVNELDWSTALKIVKQTYSRGAAYQLQRLFTGHNMLPEDVANEVLSNAIAYPASLWDAAESVASARARSAVRAVGQVAKSEKWFVE
jgi:hypothetical protein